MPPLYADETAQYHIANSISSNTESLAFNLRNSLISYTWLIGLNPLGVRLPSALYGSILIVISYFFGTAVSKGNNKISLITALLFSLVPWAFMISRIGHASIPVMLILILLHLCLYLKSKTIIGHVVSFFPLALASIYYPSMVIIIPIVSIPVLIGIFKLVSRKQKMLFIGLTTGVVIFSSILLASRYNLFSQKGRALQLAIWGDVNTTWQTDIYRALSWNSKPSLFSFYLPPEKLANKLVYNRIHANISTFTHNYLSFFSPDWLFLRGDPILRHSTSQVGALYLFLAPLLLYGAFVFFNTANKKTKQTFLIWILVSPIPAALTKDGAGYLLRAVTMLPFLTYFSALGIAESYHEVKKNLRIPYGILLVSLGLYSSYYFFFGYFHVYPVLSARSYEYGFKELSDFQVAYNNASMLIIWDGYYHNNDFRFWQKTPFYQYNSFIMKEIVVGESHVFQTYPNLFFVNPKSLDDIKKILIGNAIDFIVLPDRYFVNYPKNIEKVLTTHSTVIKYPDQTTAFTIYKLN